MAYILPEARPSPTVTGVIKLESGISSAEFGPSRGADVNDKNDEIQIAIRVFAQKGLTKLPKIDSNTWRRD